MSDPTQPFAVAITGTTGVVRPAGATETIERRLADMRGAYQDAQAADDLIATTNPVLYRVHAAAIPDEPEHLVFGTTVLQPGKVGDEFFMTKGHFHEVERTAEVYHCLSGRGVILMETRDGDTAEQLLEPRQAVYIPPGWAHRSVNVGDEPFVFFYAMPGGAGHDYRTFEEIGFRRIVVERDGEAVILPHPRRG